MPQETNLNVSPYFDDFDSRNGYHRVLFKPGYPVQSRELTTLQSILQNQIEKFGEHTFKEGSVVIPGNLTYKNDLSAVILENNFNGISIERYVTRLIGAKIIGEDSGVSAIIKFYISPNEVINNTTIYVKYLDSDTENNSRGLFLDGENLILDSETISTIDETERIVFPQVGNSFATTISQDCNSIGSAVFLDPGVYFLRGHFVEVNSDILLLDPYSNTPNYRVGFRVFEEIISSDKDESLNDNSRGFSNYAAPGADRFRIFTQLDKIPLNENISSNFIELFEVRDGKTISIKNTPEYNILSQELARRTYEQSGNYYVKSPIVTIKESLNNNKGNDGIFQENSLTYNNNSPSEDIGVYIVSPTKVYIKGFEVETISPTFLDFPKPRTTKKLEGQSINYFTGPTLTLNRVYGSPVIGFGNTYIVSLRDSRVGEDQTQSPGEEIGLARVYDFALESGSYNTANLDLNEWDITLYDIQTYTKIELNEPLSLDVPSHIKGRQSGSIGYLKDSISDSKEFILYNTKGNFSLGERIIIDGIQNNRIITNIKTYELNDIKSLYGVSDSLIFSGDVIQDPIANLGEASITGSSSGISTVILSDVFLQELTPGNLVSFFGDSFPLKTFAKVESVSDTSITISGVTTVSGICDGKLPDNDIVVNSFNILSTNLQSSQDNTLYTPLPKGYVSDLDLSKSNIKIKKQFDITINSDTTEPITSGQDETFLPFDEERYVLVRDNGLTEPLSSDKFEFSNGSKTLVISGLIGSGNGKLIATLRKTKVKSKVKIKKRVETLLVDKSIFDSSGIGDTTKNDGLIYGNYPYGTRVQDEEICLLSPDATKLYAVFESTGINDPELPSLILNELSGPTNTTGDLLIGEEFVGEKSNSIGIFVRRENDLKISFVYLNSNRLINGEKISFRESSITCKVVSVGNGDRNITSLFSIDNNQKDTIYDISKITRNSNTKFPTRKILVVFERSYFSPNDDGDIITANSYEQFDYCDIGSINGIKYTDIIDVRPRVSSFSVEENSRSPFEFLSRNFNNPENNSTNILSSDDSILLDYSFYLPRIDKIQLSKDGNFQISQGVPSEIPQVPPSCDDCLDLATITLPPYLCSINEVKVDLKEYKRYRMSDIKKLEDRVKNLEYYTTLSLLESGTSTLLITDENGLNRFKSGFFVDDFSTTNFQKKETIVKNSIDITNSELRPTHHTTSLDLLLGTNSIIGISESSDSTIDYQFDNDLIGSNVKRTGQLITLDYDEVESIVQPYSSRVTNVSPFASNYFSGIIKLFPSSDVWVDQVIAEPKTTNAEGNFSETISQLESQGFDPQTGFGPVTWNSWEDVWTGSTSSTSTIIYTRGRRRWWRNRSRIKTIETTTRTGTSTREGTRQIVREEFDTSSGGFEVLSSEVIPYIRSRNIQFTAKGMKPFTQVYAFFDGIDVNKFIIPKLIEIEMSNGIFEVGETIVGINPMFGIDSKQITFRCSQLNHRDGPYNRPTDVYQSNPYDRNLQIPNEYSSTSTIINVDTFSLSNQVQGEFSGYIEPGMILRGKTSGAEAVVRQIRLITDNTGILIGSFFIPDGNLDVNPKFESGTKSFRLTNTSINVQIPGALTTSAEENYFVEGRINTIQENIIVTRNARIDTQQTSESRTISETGSPIVVKSSVIGRASPPPPPPRSFINTITTSVSHSTVAGSPETPRQTVSLDWNPRTLIRSITPTSTSSSAFYIITFNQSVSDASISSFAKIGAGGGSQPTLSVAEFTRLNSQQYRLRFRTSVGDNFSRSFNIRATIQVSSPPIPPPKVYNGIATGILPDGTTALVSQYVGGLTAQGTIRQVFQLHAPAINRALADGYSLSSIQNWINAQVGLQVSKSTLASFGLTPGPKNILV